MFNSKTYGLVGVLAVAVYCPVAIKATPPPPPPPPAESVEIAKGFWLDRAKLRWSLEVATKGSINDTISYMLARKKIKTDTKKGREQALASTALPHCVCPINFLIGHWTSAREGGKNPEYGRATGIELARQERA